MTDSREYKVKFWPGYETILSVPVGGFSLFSMAQNALDFGVWPVLENILSFYRQLGQFVFGWIGLPFNWEVPLWLTDVLSLHLVLNALVMRAFARNREVLGDPDDPWRPTVVQIILLTPIFLFVPFGAFYFFVMVVVGGMMPLNGGRSGTNVMESHVFRSHMQVEALYLILAALSVFATNAYGISVS